MPKPAHPVVDPIWLRAHLGDPDLVLLDVRWALPEGADRAGYLAGHIPGARFVDLDGELADPPGPAGRHPLPTPQRFSQAMRRAGVSGDSRVVVYDAGTAAAARAWWLLQATSHPWAGVLDGGLRAWTASGGPLERLEPPAGAGDFHATSFAGWVSADQMSQLLASGATVLDARSGERFRGEPSPLDPRPGHVPGARSWPWTEAFRDGGVLQPDAIAARSAAISGDGPPAVAYCGSGVTACALILALESAGISGVRLYPGSWSEWAQDRERPVEVGD